MHKLIGILIVLFVATTCLGQAKKPSARKAITRVEGNKTPSINRGKTVYATHCLVCHPVDGGGVPNLNPPLTPNNWVKGPKVDLVLFILKGSKGQVEIDGDTFHNSMPAQAFLTDQQIADVLTYVRNNFGNKSSVVTPAEVKAVRAKTK